MKNEQTQFFSPFSAVPHLVHPGSELLRSHLPAHPSGRSPWWSSTPWRGRKSYGQQHLKTTCCFCLTKKTYPSDWVRFLFFLRFEVKRNCWCYWRRSCQLLTEIPKLVNTPKHPKLPQASHSLPIDIAIALVGELFFPQPSKLLLLGHAPGWPPQDRPTRLPGTSCYSPPGHPTRPEPCGRARRPKASVFGSKVLAVLALKTLKKATWWKKSWKVLGRRSLGLKVDCF